MLLKFLWRTAIILFLPVTVFAGDFLFTPNCVNAYKLTTALRIDEARALLEKEKTHNPENLLPLLIENYIDFAVLFVSEDSELFQQRKRLKDLRIETIEKSGNRQSPFYLFSLAEINLQWAFTRIHFQEYLPALFEIRKAYKLLEENERKHPAFILNKKSLGLLHVLLSTIPDKYQWAIELLGMDGDLQGGLAELREVMYAPSPPHSYFSDEAAFIYTMFILLVQKDGEQAWQLVNELDFPHPDHLISTYVAANTALFSNHNDEAIRILENKPEDARFHPFPYLDFLTGLAYLRKLDPRANQYFRRYLEQTHSKHHIKDAWQKLGWMALLSEDTMTYYQCMYRVKTTGEAVIGADKQALKEAEKGDIPDIRLLKARLLFDGGYFEQAARILEPFDADDFSELKHQTEFHYRLGRIYHEWGKTSLAVEHYKKALELGNKLPYYYAASAALHLGYIYRQMNDISRAKQYFITCLESPDHEYKSELDQKARAALNELKGL